MATMKEGRGIGIRRKRERGMDMAGHHTMMRKEVTLAAIRAEVRGARDTDVQSTRRRREIRESLRVRER